MIFDEESKKKVMEYDNFKKQYYKAKYHAKKEEFMKKYKIIKPVWTRNYQKSMELFLHQTSSIWQRIRKN
jgi:hypothetical protein